MTQETALRRVLIVDDELPARRLLSEYLRSHPEWTVVGEARDGLEAVRLAGELRPDLVLLDVQMPKLDGFEALGSIDPSVAVIFTTAFDQYALRAFEVHAVDYLLKPFSQKRFDEALSRVTARLGARRAVPDHELARAARASGAFPERLVARDGGTLTIVQVDDVDYFQGQDDYVEVFFRGRSCLLSQTLRSLESTLDPSQFVRIHRSYLLNALRIDRVEPADGSGRVVVLQGGRTLPISRSGEARLRPLLDAMKR
jgi:two-component system LytT family response regulator